MEKGPHTARELQGLIVIGLILPFLLLWSISGTEQLINRYLKSFVDTKILKLQGFGLDAFNREWVLLMISLSTPHVFYFWLWTHADSFLRFCRKMNWKNPVNAFATIAHLIKLQQGVCFAIWYAGGVESLIKICSNPTDLAAETIMYLTAMNPIQLIIGVELLLLGQVFNVGVYNAIGEAGVYYGCRLGHQIPWVYGFPFNVIAHPQYRGATLSIYGIVLLLATDVAISRGIYSVAIIMGVYYYISGYVEEFM